MSRFSSMGISFLLCKKGIRIQALPGAWDYCESKVTRWGKDTSVLPLICRRGKNLPILQTKKLRLRCYRPYPAPSLDLSSKVSHGVNTAQKSGAKSWDCGALRPVPKPQCCRLNGTLYGRKNGWAGRPGTRDGPLINSDQGNSLGLRSCR